MAVRSRLAQLGLRSSPPRGRRRSVTQLIELRSDPREGAAVGLLEDIPLLVG
jgi:hypothetical protein